MNHSELQSGNNGANTIQADWNVETITEQIFLDLDGAVSRSTIQEVLKKVIPKYEGAQIQTYVPIFIRRDAVNQLQSMQATFASPGMAINEVDGRDESLANSDLSQHKIARDEQGETIGAGLIHWKPAT